MFVLVDEFGAASGIITLENVIEEVVGQIEDEFDAETPSLIQIQDDVYEADGSCALAKVMAVTGLEVGEGEADSVGGLLVQSLDRIPRVGKMKTIGSHRITVLDADDRHVIRVRIETVDPAEDSSPE